MIKVGRAGLLVLGLAVNAFGATVASAQVRSPSQLPVGVDLPDADPSELVAARIRAALASPDSPESWADLAEVLPGLGEDTGPSAAVLVADSIGRAAARSGAGGSTKMIDKARTAWLATIRRARDAARFVDAGISAMGIDPPAGALIAGATGCLLIISGWTMRRRARIRAQRARWSTSPIDGVRPDSVVSIAYDLATGGVPLLEISRRTGMAQDVLRFALAQTGPLGPPRTHGDTGAGAAESATGGVGEGLLQHERDQHHGPSYGGPTQ